MAYKYEYYFVQKGKTRDNNTCNNEIWLDVGGKIEESAFDHHNCKKGYVSTVDVLLHEIGLLEETKKKLDINQLVRIYLHINPDIDALFACYFLKYYLDNGSEAFTERFIYSHIGDIIIEYVNNIDLGTHKNIDAPTLYNLVCHLDLDVIKNYWDASGDVELSNKMMEEALGWVEKAIICVESNSSFNLYDWDFPIEEDDLVANEIAHNVVEAGKYNYERDKREGRLIVKDIPIWTKKGDVETVKAAIWREIPLSPGSSYIYARKEGVVVTFVPHNEYGNNAARVSINPNIQGAVEKYSLIEVAEMYEQMEQIYDRKKQSETGSLRRDYSRPREDEKSKIFLDKPFSMTVDPWFVSEKGDMVDAPGNGGSLIPIEVLIGILENITKMVKKTYIVDLQLDIVQGKVLKSVYKWGKEQESLMKWTDNMKDRLSNVHDNVYPLIIVEVDSSLISHNYDILDAYFMLLSDGAYVDVDNKNVLRLDYRTHLYVNQSNAVLFIATSDKTSNDMQMNGLLDWTDEKSVESSGIVEVFSKILYQREKFKELGRFLGKFKGNNKNIKKKKEELIILLAKAQADECIDTQVELDTFRFIYEALNIPTLRESVKETMGLVSEYSKERVYANLNFLSLITIPFILLSTLFQVGMFRFKPLLDLDVENLTVPVGVPWLVSLAVVIVVTMIFLCVRKRK